MNREKHGDRFIFFVVIQIKKYIGLNVGIDFNFATVSHQCCQMVKALLKYYHSSMQSCTLLPLELSRYVYFFRSFREENR